MSSWDFGDFFVNDMARTGVRTDKGSTGYKKKNWLGITTGYVDTITPVIDDYKNLVSKKGENFGSFSQGELNLARTSFNDYGLKNLREAYTQRMSNEAMDLREEAAGEKARTVKVTSLAKAQQNRQARMEALQKQKRLIESADSTSGNSLGATMTYDRTGYARNNFEDDYFGQQFDEQIQSRREEYAQEYGFDSYESANSGWAINSNWKDDGLEPGTQDIDTMVLGDMLGMSYEDLSRIFLVDDSEGYNEEGTSKTLEGLRETYQAVLGGGADAADKLADEEDKFREKGAVEARREIISDQIANKNAVEEGSAQNISEIKRQMRATEAGYKKTESALTEGSSYYGPTVGGVNIQAERPE